MNNLFIVAHPDDESLGAGGTIRKLHQDGERIAVMILSLESATRTDITRQKIKRSHSILGVDKTYIEDFEMMKFGEIDRFEFTKKIEKVINEEKPDRIFTHYIGDIHNDHRITAQIVAEAIKLPFRQTGYKKPIQSLYWMEIPSSTDWGDGRFKPTAFSEVTKNELKAKVESLSVYEGVIREVPHPRNNESIIALARYRGGQCGKTYAEAFMGVFELL